MQQQISASKDSPIKQPAIPEIHQMMKNSSDAGSNPIIEESSIDAPTPLNV